jgi:hypothetical protein
MLILKSTDTLQVVTGAAVTVDVVASFMTWDGVASTAPVPDKQSTLITTATTSTVVAAPPASNTRNIKSLSVQNRSAASSVVVTINDVGGATAELISVTLGAKESIKYDDEAGWRVLDRSGREKNTSQSDNPPGFTTRLFKVGTAPEAAGSWYCYAKDTGFPGAWIPGTPGLNGRATDGTTAADAGSVLLLNPPSGNNYLSGGVFSASVAQDVSLFDLMWVNSGLVVTTTTAQAITPVALPARDDNGTSNGAGCRIGLLVTTATTNASAVTTITASYTNQDGTAGKTATISSFPATAVIGTAVWFQLAAGDSGVRSVQSITLGTTLTAGAVSVIVARSIVGAAASLANVPSFAAPLPGGGGKLFNGTCLLPFGIASAVTATTINAHLAFEIK